MQPNPPSITTGFRLAMRRMAATVNVITTADAQGRFHGMAATSVASISMDPPSILACVNRKASMYAHLCDNGGFCINVLSSAQTDQCRLFSSAQARIERFNGGLWETGYGGLPYLVDAQANIFCRFSQRHAFGTHDICIGLVHDVRVAEAVKPLIYLDGQFAAATAAPGS